MPPDVIQMLIDGQKALFAELRSLRDVVQDMGVQRNELAHVNLKLVNLEEVDDDQEKRIKTMENGCLKKHLIADRREKSFGRRLIEACVMAVVVGAVLTFCSILGFTMFVNTQAFYDFQHTQVNKEQPLKGKIP